MKPRTPSRDSASLAIGYSIKVSIEAIVPESGMSDAAPDPQTIEDYALTVVDALTALGYRGAAIDVLGYHTGAAVAAHLALDTSLQVRRVVLAAVPVFSDDERASFGV